MAPCTDSNSYKKLGRHRWHVLRSPMTCLKMDSRFRQRGYRVLPTMFSRTHPANWSKMSRLSALCFIAT